MGLAPGGVKIRRAWPELQVQADGRMMRGLILGAASGLALSALALGGLSLIAEQPAGNRPPEAPTTDAPATERPPGEADVSTGRPLAEEAGPQSMEPAPGLAPPEESGAPRADTASAAQPDIASPGDALPVPAPVAEGPSRERPPEERVTLAPQSPALRPPVAEALPQAAPAVPPPRGTPAGPPEMDAPDEEDAAAVTAMTAAEDAPLPSGMPATPEAAMAAPDLPDSPDAVPPAQPDAALDLAALAQPDDGAPPVVAGDGDIPTPGMQVPLAPATAPDDAPDDTPGVTEAHEGPTPLISLQGEMPRLPGGDSGVLIRRPGGDDPVREAEDESAAPALPPIWQAATDFQNTAGLPPVAIVLIDDGSLPMAVQIVTSLDLPVTIALDPTRPEAAEAGSAYHAAGIEVAALAALPDGASATDAVVALQASFATLPEAVALVDANGTVAASRDLAQASVGWLGAEGRGLAWLASGADQAQRVAEAADLPARAILRDLDGNGQEEAVIRRFLDNAPMRARQDGAAVLLARLRPETVNALSLWSATARAASVTLAPLSVALTEGREPPPGE